MTDSTTPATQALLPVTPEDRRAAASIYQRFLDHDYAGWILAGTNAGGDADFVLQVIAAHRISHSLPGDVGMLAWRTIDSAPTDGDTILAICASAYTPTAFDTWWQDGWTHYSRPEDKWHGGVGKWFPTHWMPRDVYLAALTPSALSGDAGEKLREAALAVVETATDYYTARNGRLCSIEGEDGEKCWIVPFDQFEDLRRIVHKSPHGAALPPHQGAE